MPASTEMLIDFGNSTKDLIAALAEMDAIIAESKFSLDNMSLSTTSTSTPKLSDHTTKSLEESDQTSCLSAENLSNAISAISYTNGHHHRDASYGHGGFSEAYLFNTSAQIEKTFQRNGHDHHASPESLSVLAQLAEELRMQVELNDVSPGQTASQLDQNTLRILKNWLDRESPSEEENGETATGGGAVDSLMDAVKRAEAERDNLQAQLTLIFEQTKTQREKIHELQDVLLDKTIQLESTEDLLREEMLSRSQLETHKLDLLTEMEDIRSRMLTNGTYTNGSAHTYSSQDLITRQNGSNENINGHFRTSPVNVMQQLRYELEQEKMRKTVELLTVKLDEKDQRIRQLEQALRLNNIRESDIGTSQGNFLPRGDDSRDGGRKPPVVARPSTTSSQRKSYTTNTNSSLLSSVLGSDESLTRYAEPEGNGVSGSNGAGARRRESSSRSNTTRTPRSRSTDARLARGSSADSQSRRPGSFRVSPLSPSKSLGEKLSIPSISSSLSYLRQRSHSNSSGQDQEEVNRCSSVPNLNGRVGSQESDQIRSSTPRSGFSEDKKHSLRKFFEKFTRSNSPQFNESLECQQQQFKRGGVRSTAGGRLQHGNSSVRRKWDVSAPLKDWTPEMAIQWLEEDVQIPIPSNGKDWLRNGHKLFDAKPSDLEKELGITHPIHRKKMQLAIKSKKESVNHPMGKLDYLLVLRWLDDIGLPQYKDAFADARIDGRTLNFLTNDDLFFLKVTNALHQASIKRGIQVLRECDFDISRIRRRAIPNESPLESPKSVLYWSSQRVLEWLQLLDLSEYNPCLRGCGVHGGLMVLDDRFNAQLFAELLSIPQSKTLLRRHLSKSFTELIGSELIRRKRAAEAAPGFVALSPHLKLKPLRKGFSLARKKERTEEESHEYICPPDLKIDQAAFVSAMSPRKDSAEIRALLRDDSGTSQPRSESSTPVASLANTNV